MPLSQKLSIISRDKLVTTRLVNRTREIRQALSVNKVIEAMKTGGWFTAVTVVALLSIMLSQVALPQYALAESGSRMNTSDSQDPAPTEDTEPFPISLKVEPTLAIIHSKDGSKASQKVTVSGDTLPLGQRPVSIVIKNSDLPPMTKEIIPGQDGPTGSGMRE